MKVISPCIAAHDLDFDRQETMAVFSFVVARVSPWIVIKVFLLTPSSCHLGTIRWIRYG